MVIIIIQRQLVYSYRYCHCILYRNLNWSITQRVCCIDNKAPSIAFQLACNRCLIVLSSKYENALIHKFNGTYVGNKKCLDFCSLHKRVIWFKIGPFYKITLSAFRETVIYIQKKTFVIIRRSFRF